MASMGWIMLGNPSRLFQVVADNYKNIRQGWALRVLILISLALQIILSLLGNLRKYNLRTRIRITLWCSYFLAYAGASVALGIITQTALHECNVSGYISQNEVMSFWAPFLLLHLGGPDSITALSMEDNELWLRHCVELAFQSIVALYILLLSWPGCSALPLLSVMVYIAGFIKCFERVQALRKANTEHLRYSMLAHADPGRKHPKFLEDYLLKKSHGFIMNGQETPDPEPHLPAIDYAYPQGHGKVISEAYDLFQTFKRLFVDIILTVQDRHSSDSYFCLQSDDAFRAVEIELGFAYDILYTKANVVYTFWGLMLRLASVLLLLLVLVGIHFLCDMSKYQVVDVAITYLLISAAVLVEIFGVTTMLRSDWTDLWLSQRNYTRNSLIFPFLKQPTKRRWSCSIGQLELLSVAMEEKPACFLQIQKFFGIDEAREKHRYKTYSEVSVDLKDLIYRQYLEFMDQRADPKELCSHKGSFSLRMNECDNLLWSTAGVEFDQSILIWHIATALCNYSELDDKDLVNIDVYRMGSNNISNYMLYLLVAYPDMLTIGINMTRYRDTCAEAVRFFKEKGPITEKIEASRKLLEVLPCEVKGDRRKSVLFDGCRLALTLREMERERMWKVTSQVWIEIIAYAATRCRGFHHMQLLGEGGEFLTHVWLLMAHLGVVCLPLSNGTVKRSSA